MENKKCQADKKELSMIQKAAKLMGKGEQFVRIGLQRQILPIGHAIQGENGGWNYYISPKLFKDYTGKDIEKDIVEDDCNEKKIEA